MTALERNFNWRRANEVRRKKKETAISRVRDHGSPLVRKKGQKRKAISHD